MTSPAHISIEGLSRSFPAPDRESDPVTVFKDVWFKIEKGEFVCLIGHPVDDDRPAGRMVEAREDVEQGRLAATGMADQADELALLDLSITNVIAAIFFIGLIGMLLDQVLAWISKFVSYAE